MAKDIPDSSEGKPPQHPKTSSSETSGFFTTAEGKVIEIRDVWASNLDEEMEIIRNLIEKYPYVAMVRKLFAIVNETVFTCLHTPCTIYFRILNFLVWWRGPLATLVMYNIRYRRHALFIFVCLVVVSYLPSKTQYLDVAMQCGHAQAYSAWSVVHRRGG